MSDDEETGTSRPDAYFWCEDKDEIRRAFIIDVMADADIDGKVLVSNMQVVFEWLSGKTNALYRSSRKVQKGDPAEREQERPQGEKP